MPTRCLRYANTPKSLVFRPEPATEDYQRLIEEARGVPVTSAAAVPLVSGEITTGLLGFIKFGDRKWHEAELNALMTIATLFAQVQARVAAEARLRYLADHDDLTGLHNRRALLQHLDQRLAPGQPGPVAALFLDLDRLKAINDYLGHAAGDQFIHVFAQRIGDALVGEPDRPTRRRRIRPHTRISNECRCRSTARRTSSRPAQGPRRYRR